MWPEPSQVGRHRPFGSASPRSRRGREAAPVGNTGAHVLC